MTYREHVTHTHNPDVIRGSLWRRPAQITLRGAHTGIGTSKEPSLYLGLLKNIKMCPTHIPQQFSSQILLFPPPSSCTLCGSENTSPPRTGPPLLASLHGSAATPHQAPLSSELIGSLLLVFFTPTLPITCICHNKGDPGTNPQRKTPSSFFQSSEFCTSVWFFSLHMTECPGTTRTHHTIPGGKTVLFG